MSGLIAPQAYESVCSFKNPLVPEDLMAYESILFDIDRAVL